mgnify:CR=1 FL=1
MKVYLRSKANKQKSNKYMGVTHISILNIIYLEINKSILKNNVSLKSLTPSEVKLCRIRSVYRG